MKKVILIIVSIVIVSSILFFCTNSLTAKGYRIFDNYSISNSSSSNYKEEVTNKVEGSYKITGIPTINCDTKFTDVIIVKGNTNEVSVVADIKLKGNDMDDLKEHIKNIKVELSQDGNKIFVETCLKGSFNNVSIEITALVTVPNEFIPEMNIKHGDIKIKSIAVGGEIKIQHGSLEAQELTSLTELNVQHSDAEIEKAEELDVNLQHSDLHITEVESIEAKFSHSDVNIDRVVNLEMNIYHTDLDIKEVNNLSFEELAFGDLTIGQLINSIEIEELKHSKLYIKNCSESLSKIDIGASHSPINISIPKTLGVNAEFKTTHGSMKVNGYKNEAYFKEQSYRNKESLELKTIGESKQICEINISTSFSNIRFSFD